MTKPVVNQERLYATTNAVVWAEEFAKVCPKVDEGLMIAWFANAIETARRIGAEEGKVAYARELLAFATRLRARQRGAS